MGEETREYAIQFLTAAQVADGKVYTPIMQYSPLLAKLMMDKLKQFLNNDYFVAIERQSVLIKFLDQHYPNDMVQEILQTIDQGSLKEDYASIIMEWTYHNSNDIIYKNLKDVDGQELCDNILPPKKSKKKQTQEQSDTDTLVQALIELTARILIENGDDPGEQQL